MFLPLQLTLKPSRIYLVVMALAHGLALAGVLLAELPAWGQLVLALLLLANGYRIWRSRKNIPRSLRVSQSGQLEVLTGEWQPASIDGQYVVLPWFINLPVLLEDKTRVNIRLWTDSTDADGLRKLRVWLRWGVPQTD